MLPDPTTSIGKHPHGRSRIYRRPEKAMEERTRAQDQMAPATGNGLDIVSPEQDIALVYDSDWGEISQ